jgi:hypothetical protein
MSERDLIDEFLLAASQQGWRFSRNNSGLAQFPDGSSVRYGLFTPGGSDCIGWMPHIVTEDDVGRTIAIFAAVEMKTGKQTPTTEQERFLRIVQRAGGIAAWGRDLQTIMHRLRK